VYLEPGMAAVGAALVLLVLAAPFLRPSRTQLFYIGMSVFTYLVSLKWIVASTVDSTLLRAMLGAVPGALQLHLHYPQRIAFLYLFFAAALAGTTLDRLLSAKGRRRYALLGAAAMALGALVAFTDSSAYPVFCLGLGVSVLIVLLAWYSRLSVSVASVLLVLVAATEVIYSARLAYDTRMSLGRPESYHNTPAVQSSAALLQSMPDQGRFTGHYPKALLSSGIGYRHRLYWSRPIVRELLLTTQATLYGLEDVQGYNPLHLALYDQLLAVANGQRQNYRSAYLLPRGLGSPLVDMLNMRYVLVARGTRLGPKYHMVHRGRSSSLYQNTHALPRGWIVHDTLVRDDLAALQLIDTHKVNLQETAVVARPVGVEPKRSVERLAIQEHQPDRIVATADMSSAGLVVFAELDYPAWKVRVDGRGRPVVRANGALRAVEVPAGTHTIEWYYSSRLTNLGFGLSAVGGLALVAALALWSRLPISRLGSGTSPSPEMHLD
ncbi:MAG: YfhO family protein, partial [Chloroflexota bacterium]|nr:YfhO family protein [Chloroflexota bacterium]